MRHNHPDYKGFVSTVLPRRVTFGEAQFTDSGLHKAVYVNNHHVARLSIAWDGLFTIYNNCGSSYAGYDLMNLIPFIGYSSEATEF